MHNTEFKDYGLIKDKKKGDTNVPPLQLLRMERPHHHQNLAPVAWAPQVA